MFRVLKYEEIKSLRNQSKIESIFDYHLYEVSKSFNSNAWTDSVEGNSKIVHHVKGTVKTTIS